MSSLSSTLATAVKLIMLYFLGNVATNKKSNSSESSALGAVDRASADAPITGAAAPPRISKSRIDEMLGKVNKAAEEVTKIVNGSNIGQRRARDIKTSEQDKNPLLPDDEETLYVPSALTRVPSVPRVVNPANGPPNNSAARRLANSDALFELSDEESDLEKTLDRWLGRRKPNSSNVVPTRGTNRDSGRVVESQAKELPIAVVVSSSREGDDSSSDLNGDEGENDVIGLQCALAEELLIRDEEKG